VSKPSDQLLLGELALPSAAFTERIDEGEQLIQNLVTDGSGWRRLVQRFETDTSMLTFGERPDRR